MGLRLTNSEMKEVSRCKRKWWLSHYRRLQPKKRGGEFNKPLGIGTRLHEALGAYYQPGDQRQDPFDTLAVGVAWDLFEYPGEEKEIKKEATLVWIMLEGYMDWIADEGLDADIRVISPESELEVPMKPIDGILPTDVTILSKIDTQVEKISTGEHGAIEHKSVGDLKKPLRKLQVDPQLLTEHLVQYLGLLEDGQPENRAKFVLYNMLRKVKRTGASKPPYFGREEVTHNLAELRSHWQHVYGATLEILQLTGRLDAGENPHVVCRPNVTQDCSWDCPFAKPCLSGLFDNGSDVEAHLEEHYEEHDPLERYISSGITGEGE